VKGSVFMMRQLVFSVMAGLLLAGTSVSARTDTQVESSRAVASPDGSRSVVVDRLTPVVDGEAERYSGQMLIRVVFNDGSPAKQRYIEASQVRVVQPPVWLGDSKICAFAYNIAKNSNGIVYFEPDTNRALQVEIVMPVRNMATGQAEQELTSFEVTEFTNETLKINNVPFHGGSAFPLVLGPLPAWQGKPYDLAFYNKLNQSLQAYKAFLARNSIKHLEPEQASESFSNDNKWLGLLACGGKDSFLLTVPLGLTQSTSVLDQAKMNKIGNVELSCAHHAAGEMSDTAMQDSRFLTKWSGPTAVQVIKESYNAETDEPVITPVLTFDVKSGAAKDLSTTSTQPAAQ